MAVSWLAILVLLMIAGGLLLAALRKLPRRGEQLVGFGLLASLFLIFLVTWSTHRPVERARVVAETRMVQVQEQARAVQERARAVQHQGEALSEEQARDVLQAQEDAIEFYRLSQDQQPVSPLYAERPPVDPMAMTAPKAWAGWQSAADLGFQADVYPSVRSAAEALIEQVLREFPRLIAPGPGVERVELYGHDMEPDVMAAVQKRLQGRDVQVDVLQTYVFSDVHPTNDRGYAFSDDRPATDGAYAFRDGHPTDDPAYAFGNDHPATDGAYAFSDDRPATDRAAVQREGIVTVRLDIPSSSTDRTRLGYDERNGTVRMQVLGNAVRFDRTARFVEKPWVADYSRFLSKVSPLQRHCIVGYSAPSGATRQEAEEAALQAAAAQLVPLVRDSAMRAPGIHPVSDATDAQLQDWIAQQLRSGEGIADRFVQSFNRPYGRVWREAVLVETAPTRIAALTSGCLARQRFDWASRAHPVFQVGALAVLICLVYLFLNAVTKGYYTRTLMGTSVVALILGVLVLLKLG